MKEHLPAEFNAALYLWEQNYFFENCLGRYFTVRSKRKELAALPGLREIAERLASFRGSWSIAIFNRKISLFGTDRLI